jgi:hypothetical protein
MIYLSVYLIRYKIQITFSLIFIQNTFTIGHLLKSYQLTIRTETTRLSCKSSGGIILDELAAVFSNCIVPTMGSQSNFVNITNCKLPISTVAAVTRAPWGKHSQRQELLLQIYREARYVNVQLVSKIKV